MELKIKSGAESIALSPEFFYEKAVEAWRQWKDLEIPADRLAEIAAMNYEAFAESTDELIDRVRTAMFRVIAYCDDHARNKLVLNEYADRRVIARAGIYQNHWFSQLLKTKMPGSQTLTPGVRNVIAFLESPEDNWPIVSENHRMWISTHILKQSYDPATFSLNLKNALAKYWSGVNDSNMTSFLTAVLYDNEQLWRHPEIRGVFMHDSDSSWKEKLIDDMGDGKGVIWWHALPSKSYRGEIITQLNAGINDDKVFELYYLSNHEAAYRAQIVDFAVAENYDEKVERWRSLKPAWFEEEISDYEDGKRQASIVFLIDRFERVKKPIHVNRFLRFRNMPDNVRTGIMAFTNIISDSEINEKENMKKYIKLLKTNRNIVLTGAPGTGKTHLAKAIADAMGAEKKMVQFHPSFDYTDFVEGLRPVMNGSQVGFQYQRGIFKEFCKEAVSNPSKDFVFIIDEINRGEIAKIFGEVFSAIDPGYRGEKGQINTQYQNLITADDCFKGGFYVPENVFIIGTMNDIDRGVESMDFAIRRRFVWVEIGVDERKDMLDELGDARAEAEKRMDNLNRAIAENENLTDEYMIGAAYFLKLKDLNVNELWELQLRPLLREYLRGTEDLNGQIAKLEAAYNQD